jgi:xylan 1,4-beta-xylosidase
MNKYIKISNEATLPPLRHPWKRCITVGRAYELLRADLQAHVRSLQMLFDYEYIRFHASFHDDVKVVDRLPDGAIVYRWTQLDHIYDFLVETGFKPIVEINPMPKALASGKQTMFWYGKNITPPKDYAEWEKFLLAYITHTVERYGIDVVREWRFEVWNEPDLRNQFWSGTKEDYFKLYTSCARVLKDFDTQLQVGGPASAGTEWVVDLADYAKDNNVPCDFLSYHNYPQNEATAYDSLEKSPHQRGMFFIDRLSATKAKLIEAGFGDLPIYITEWNSQAHDADGATKWSGNENVNNLFAGACVCHIATGCDELVDVLGWWVASDVFEEGGPQVEPYGSRYQYYGLLTIDGVPKSSFHGFEFLSQLKGARYQVEVPEGIPGTCGLVCTDEKSLTRCLIWNARFPDQDQEDWTGVLSIPVASLYRKSEAVRCTTAKVMAGQGSAYEFWKEMGEPASLTRREQAALKARSVPLYESGMKAIKSGFCEIDYDLKPNEFMLIEIGGEAAASDATPSDAMQTKLNQQLQT